MKQTGKPSAGKPPAGFDAAGAGNLPTVRLVRHSQRKRGATDRLNLRGNGARPRPYCAGGTERSVSLPRHPCVPSLRNLSVFLVNAPEAFVGENGDIAAERPPQYARSLA